MSFSDDFDTIMGGADDFDTLMGGTAGGVDDTLGADSNAFEYTDSPSSNSDYATPDQSPPPKSPGQQPPASPTTVEPKNMTPQTPAPAPTRAIRMPANPTIVQPSAPQQPPAEAGNDFFDFAQFPVDPVNTTFQGIQNSTAPAPVGGPAYSYPPQEPLAHQQVLTNYYNPAWNNELAGQGGFLDPAPAGFNPTFVNPQQPLYNAQYGAPLPPAQLGQPAAPAPMLPVVQGGVKINHHRKDKHQAGNDPTAVYQMRPAMPSWGPPRGPRNKPTFDYSGKGVELYPSARYTSDELVAFFRGDAGVNAQTGRNLTLWVQNTPAQVNDRYHHSTSSGKCRYDRCPDRQGTILKGFFRVAFDERSAETAAGIFDPFHNAGYMHLYCFEKLYDLAFIYHYAHQRYGFQVRPDIRHLPHESRNPMTLTRDHHELLAVFNRWMAEQLPRCNALLLQYGNDPLLGFRPVEGPVREEQRLWYHLTTEHLERESEGRGRARAKRNGGADIANHKGNLERYFALRNQQKRKRVVSDDDDEETEEETPRANKRQRPLSPYRKRPLEIVVGGDSRPHKKARTRRESQQESEAITEALVSPHLTRQEARNVQHWIQGQPEHVQDRLLSMVPEYVKPVLDVHMLDNLGRLSTWNHREKQAKGGDPRRLATYP
ncbi:hypothetical protein B0T22DRAFT_294049 [Podospora appendiculata]|uniref:Uncharacterized protein n=1 Tax=Podospora appendiculata TaxID=314037 RepID=A0AAE1C8H4_9PEZI|nr:hypothetical protein B0T22DRAFT_294049 [Podospora appendiculata]